MDVIKTAVNNFDISVERRNDRINFSKELEFERKMIAFVENTKGKVQLNKIPGYEKLAPYYYVDYFDKLVNVYIITRDRGMKHCYPAVATSDGRKLPRYILMSNKEHTWEKGKANIIYPRDINKLVKEYFISNNLLAK